MKKPMTIMLICVGILFGCVFAYKFVMGMIIKRYMQAMTTSSIETVSATKAQYAEWQPQLKAVGSMRAVTGVDVTAEVAGMVTEISLTPGSIVEKGEVLAQLDAIPDLAQLRNLEASAELAKITYNRDKLQYKAKAISKAQLDTDAANLKSADAQVAQQEALVVEKTIRAPFTGRLGISKINPGQYINPGDKIVTLQSLDPIYVDFYLPQQALAVLKVGQNVTLTSDSFPNKNFQGKITTINPVVDTNTRNVEVEATLPNPDFELIPGMFANVEVETGTPEKHLTLPITAVSFNPYGEIVYLIQPKGKDKTGKPILIATQKFVSTGDIRGDQIIITDGVKAGDWVVTSGQVKLKNGYQVIINNKVVPANNPAPNLPDV